MITETTESTGLEAFKIGYRCAIADCGAALLKSRMEHDQMGRGGHWSYNDAEHAIKSIAKKFDAA